jgi:adenylate cyclase
MTRGVARAALGISGWRDDLSQAVSISRAFDLTSRAMVTSFVHGVAISQGWLLATGAALREADELVGLARNFGDDVALGCAEVGRLVIALHLDEQNRRPGMEDIAEVRALAQRVGVGPWVPLIDVLTAKRAAADGDGRGAVAGLRALVRDLDELGEMGWRSLAMEELAALLLRHGGAAGLDEAATVIDDLAALTRERGAIAYDPPVLRLRALLAQSEGDLVVAREMARQYLASATKLGFEGHIVAASAMWRDMPGTIQN